jgi:Fe-S-cluster-containing dehydrogenase component
MAEYMATDHLENKDYQTIAVGKIKKHSRKCSLCLHRILQQELPEGVLKLRVSPIILWATLSKV